MEGVHLHVGGEKPSLLQPPGGSFQQALHVGVCAFVKVLYDVIAVGGHVGGKLEDEDAHQVAMVKPVKNKNKFTVDIFSGYKNKFIDSLHFQAY